MEEYFRQSQKSLLFVRGEINGYEVRVMLDTGAQSSVIPEHLIPQLGLDRLVDRRFRGEARGAGNTPVTGILFGCSILFGTSSSAVEASINFKVIETAMDMIILGNDFMKENDCILSFRDHTIQLKEITLSLLDSNELDLYERPRRIPLINPLVRDKMRLILSNILSHPAEAKYRSLRISALSTLPECLPLLTQLGFQPDASAERITYSSVDLTRLQQIFIRFST